VRTVRSRSIERIDRQLGEDTRTTAPQFGELQEILGLLRDTTTTTTARRQIGRWRRGSDPRPSVVWPMGSRHPPVRCCGLVRGELAERYPVQIV
jgi:hypothetical protein